MAAPTSAVPMASPWIEGASNSGQLLYWMLDGPLESAISVILDPTDLEKREPYYRPSTGIWHPVAKWPISVGPVSSITVHVSFLGFWEDFWCDEHWDHSDPDRPHAVEVPHAAG